MCMLSANTHFCDTLCTDSIQPSSTSLWPQFMYYIIFLSMAQAHSIYGGNWGSMVWRGWVGFFGPFAWAQLIRATKWTRDTGSTSCSWRISCTQNFHHKRVFMLWLIVDQSFYPNLILLPYFLFQPKNTADPKLIS